MALVRAGIRSRPVRRADTGCIRAQFMLFHGRHPRKGNDMNGKATAGRMTVSELNMGAKLGDNIIVIAMRRDDAGFIKDVLRHYRKTKDTKKTMELCVELLDRMDECFP